ncbi:glycosyltransferase family 4 protein [Nonlabens antarcticus]|uniref:glycosyltransferase family 4 protein n=1 Tax=Nonlabens antarcticus TaxID=392714 RepID=UPI00189140A0|nr:glycosyltransferase family 4 protein [Nonlabens antarcticus]
MRVLQIIDSLHPGGAERMAVNIANGLQDKVEFSALCTTREEGLLKDRLKPGVGYLFANRTGKIGISGFLRVHRFIKKHAITHIHAHSTSIFTGWILKLLRPHLVFIWHDHYGNADFLQNRPKRFLKLMCKKTDSVIVVNRKLLQWAQKNRLGNKIFFLANFAKAEVSNKKQSQLIPGIEGKRLVCLANLRPQKNQLLLIDVWEKIQERYADWDLLLVGKCFGDDYEQQVRASIETKQLSQSIHILGSRTDVDDILNKSTIGVLSSISEGLPLALLEYGLAGLPVVVTDVGACREVVQDKGILVKPNSHPELQNALMELMDHPELHSQYGNGLKERVDLHYSEKNYLTELLQIYQV